MRLAKIIAVIFMTVILGGATTLTAAIYTGSITYYVLALWLGILVLIGSLLSCLRVYQRVITRLGVANERLKELRFLQERRYDQLRVRLDRIISEFHSNRLSQQPIEMGASRRGTAIESELDDLNSRLQRSERRILGSISDEFAETDKRHQQIQETLSKLLQNDVTE